MLSYIRFTTKKAEAVEPIERNRWKKKTATAGTDFFGIFHKIYVTKMYQDDYEDVSSVRAPLRITLSSGD
jgi:hypothetical protein